MMIILFCNTQQCQLPKQQLYDQETIHLYKEEKIIGKTALLLIYYNIQCRTQY